MRNTTHNHLCHRPWWTALLLILTLVVAVPAAAMSLEEAMEALGEAKTRGLVGEQADGYLGVVREEGQAASIARLINEARRREYRRVARENDLALRDVEALAGRKAIERTPAGQYIRTPDGEWRRK
ncbi:MAG: DUF1318 domain-containing protein [Desulfurivibrio sp.]|nr:DUF1318 domain-containing protein [Desulfurivibrio sp.]